MDEHKESYVLVVDDNPNNLRLLISILKREKISVRPAKNGRTALELAKTNPPDLILMDILMPEMDGYETCRQIKANPTIQDIPVIFLSALDFSFDKVKAFRVGGVDYVSKPFNEEELLARISTHLHLRNVQKKLAEKNSSLHREIIKRERIEQEREGLIRELKAALAEVKTLQGFLPICSNCKKIRDDEGYWQQIEKYIQERSDAQFSHGICPDCIRKLYPEIANKLSNKL